MTARTLTGAELVEVLAFVVKAHQDREEAAEVEDICDDCGDPIEDGTGCHHDGHDWCSACFLHHCTECASDYYDDMRAEAAMERWRDER